MNRTSWIVIVVLCVVGLGGLIYMNKGGGINVDDVNPISLINSTDEALGDNVYGNRNAKVVLFEYADFQCPGCGAANQNIPKIKDLYKDKVAFVFRNYPLVSIHPNALAAASAVEAAGIQGKYWEMHSIVFTNQSQWSSQTAENRGRVFDSFATQLGLDMNKFKEDMAGAKVQKKIQTDMAIGGKVGVSGTPTFFIGDKELGKDIVDDILTSGGGTKMMDSLDQALKDAGETPPERAS